VIPLCPNHHVGRRGADSSVGIQTWEKENGPQLLHLFRVGLSLGIDVFDRAGVSLDKLYSCACSNVTASITPGTWRSLL